MSDEKNTKELSTDYVVQAKVAEIWDVVFRASTTVIGHANLFGFDKIGTAPQPNIHEILIYLRMFNSIIDFLLARTETHKINIDETRTLLNSKQQLHCMEMIANAVSKNDRVTYDHYLAQLASQSCI